MMKCLLIPLLLIASLSQSEINRSLPPKQSPTHYTDQRLKELTIEYGVIPKNADEAYLQTQKEENKTITIWILLEHKKKVALIDNIKKMFLEKKSIIIKNPTEYYVNEINNVIYNSAKNDKYFITTKEGIGVIFRTIALQEGDFDNGKGKIETLREYMGEDKFEWYKETYPEKYQFLVEMDKEVQ